MHNMRILGIWPKKKDLSLGIGLIQFKDNKENTTHVYILHAITSPMHGIHKIDVCKSKLAAM